jgi:hypothetical protein
VSGIFVLVIAIIGFNIAVRLFIRSRRGPRGRLGGRMGGRPPGYGQWQQGPGAYGYDSNGNPIEPGFGQPGFGQPGSGQPGSGGHHASRGGFGEGSVFGRGHWGRRLRRRWGPRRRSGGRRR